MKKFKKYTLIILSVSILFLCGCNNYEVATNFNETPIENSVNNCLSGGKILLKDGSLYCVNNIANTLTFGTYKLYGGKSENIIADVEVNVDYAFAAPVLYKYNQDILSIDTHNNQVLKYDETLKTFIESDFDIKPHSNNIYLSKKLIVYFSDNNTVEVINGNSKYTLDINVMWFTIKDETIYAINTSGFLYSNDIKNNSGKCTFVNNLNGTASCTVFTVCGDYIYYNSNGSNVSDFKTGLYRYSLVNKTNEFIEKGNILGFNSFKDTFYYSKSNGIYSCTEKSNKLLCNINADKIYIVDNKWLYLYCENSEIFRVTKDGNCIEKVMI